jgi:hypothetical protein
LPLFLVLSHQFDHIVSHTIRIRSLASLLFLCGAPAGSRLGLPGSPFLREQKKKIWIFALDNNKQNKENRRDLFESWARLPAAKPKRFP